MPDHSDSFSKVKPPEAQGQKAQPQQANKPVNNDAQAALAEENRQREFTVGDDGVEDGSAAATPPARAMVASAITRIRGVDRPSPFGTAFFPPLPEPPARR